MRTIKLLITLVLLGLSYNSFAQCPQGIPNNPGCVPPDAWYPQGNYQAPAPQKRWVKTWGAIAIDTTTEVTFAGTSVGEDSKRKAIAAAIKKCKSNGGGENCRSVVEYHNQCVAFAQGDGGGTVSNAETTELVTKNALAQCNKSYGPECKIIYTECTKPYVK